MRVFPTSVPLLQPKLCSESNFGETEQHLLGHLFYALAFCRLAGETDTKQAGIRL